MADEKQTEVTDLALYREEKLSWPHEHVTEAQIKLEYERIKEVFSNFVTLDSEIVACLDEASHHVTSFFVYSWIVRAFVDYCFSNFGISNRFYETDMNLEYLKPITHDVLDKGGLRIRFELVEMTDKAHKSLVVLKFVVKVMSATNEVLAQTREKDFLTLIGPYPEIFISEEENRAYRFTRR